MLVEPVQHPLPEGGHLALGAGVLDAHRRAELAPVLEQGAQLGFGVPLGAFYVVGFVGLPQQQGGRTVGRGRLFWKEMGIARRHYPVGEQEPGGAMVRVQAVALPRVMAQHQLGTQPADPVGDLPALVGSRFQFAVGPAQARRGSRTTRNGSRSRAASAWWRAKEPGPYAKRNPVRAGTQATLVPSSRRSGTSVTPGKLAVQETSMAMGRSAWATMT